MSGTIVHHARSCDWGETTGIFCITRCACPSSIEPSISKEACRQMAVRSTAFTTNRSHLRAPSLTAFAFDAHIETRVHKIM